jgi:cellulose synthase/poly-beta-1,6-N-acetylglucosamine synthase-like glycosyltransferase
MTGPFFTALFWIGVLEAGYAYVGFPMLAAFLARRSDRSGDTLDRPAAAAVTVVIPAYNEERSIETKIRNVLAADYPPALLDVIVVSDASTDGTDAIARAFASHGVRLIVQPVRQGKTAGLNRALAIASGSIVVFTDANATYDRGTIAKLAGYFADSRIGLVSGYTRYTQNGDDVGEATNRYTSLERRIKIAESRWGCCVGADGAIFAMRRSLYRTLREDDINDFVLPLSVIDQGYRCVLAADAACSENPGQNLDSEFQRQSRITNRTLRALWRNRRLLNPLRFPVFSFFLFSHKVARFLVPIFLTLSAIALAVLALTDRFWMALALCATAILLLALFSEALAPASGQDSVAGKLLRFLNVFLTINAAVLAGWWKFLSGNAEVTWGHDRSAHVNSDTV